MIAIKAENLGRRFSSKSVLQGLNFEIPLGESVALMGPNGSGKTTLLRILCTLLLPSEGDVWILNHSLVTQSKNIKHELGWGSATDRGFIPRFTGLENLQFFGSLRGLSRQRITDQIERWMKMDVIAAALDTPFYLCSTGMKQSLSIIRATLTDPRILFLDEPTRSLDSKSSESLRDLLKHYAKGRTLICATHSEEEARILTSRRFVLDGGQLRC